MSTTLRLNELWRFKSEIPLTIAKRVEKMRSKVNTARHFNHAFTGADGACPHYLHHHHHQTNSRPFSTTEQEDYCPASYAHNGTEYGGSDNDDVYGDDWSTTDEEDEEGTGKTEENRGTSALPFTASGTRVEGMWCTDSLKVSKHPFFLPSPPRAISVPSQQM